MSCERGSRMTTAHILQAELASAPPLTPRTSRTCAQAHSLQAATPRNIGTAGADDDRHTAKVPSKRVRWGPLRMPRGVAAEGSVEVVAQDLRARRVPQLAHGLGLDLADPLTRDAVDLADLV